MARHWQRSSPRRKRYTQKSLAGKGCPMAVSVGSDRGPGAKNSLVSWLKVGRASGKRRRGAILRPNLSKNEIQERPQARLELWRRIPEKSGGISDE